MSNWVGDGFPVRSLFSYQDDPAPLSPFLLFDYAGPHVTRPRMMPGAEELVTDLNITHYEALDIDPSDIDT